MRKKAKISLVSLDSITVWNRTYYILGGIKISSMFLQKLQSSSSDIIFLRIRDVIVSSSSLISTEILNQISYDHDQPVLSKSLSKQFSYKYIQISVIMQDLIQRGELFILHPKAELNNALTELDKRFFAITIVGFVIAIILAIWRANSIVAPLRKLSNIASSLSLDKLEANFNVSGSEEVAVLNNTMKKMIHRLRRNKMELTKAEQKATLSDLALHITHDIKNGFVPIKNVMNHLEEVTVTHPENLVQIFNERKTTVFESLAYLEYLVRNYSQIRPTSNRSVVKINQLIDSLINQYRDLQETGRHITFWSDSSEPTVYADAMQLRRAFDNLLQNAFDAIIDNGQIIITTTTAEKEVVITLQDNGSGIPENVKEKLFKSYITSKEHGSGIGLINVKNIIENLGGTIHIESQIGEGTIIRLQLPLNRSDNP